jgi:hypothetical protein
MAPKQAWAVTSSFESTRKAAMKVLGVPCARSAVQAPSSSYCYIAAVMMAQSCFYSDVFFYLVWRYH